MLKTYPKGLAMRVARSNEDAPRFTMMRGCRGQNGRSYFPPATAPRPLKASPPCWSGISAAIYNVLQFRNPVSDHATLAALPLHRTVLTSLGLHPRPRRQGGPAAMPASDAAVVARRGGC